MQNDYSHEAVLKQAVIDALVTKNDGYYIDGTFGRGGHSAAILAQLQPEGRLLAIDKDPTAMAHAEEHFADESRFTIEQGSFAQIAEFAKKHDLVGKINGVFLDLGVSSPQLDDAERGFSFLRDGPLDMRMDPNHGLSAADWINQAEAKDIAHVLKEYGEERFAKRIANAIVKARTERPIRRTGELAEIVKVANPSWEKHKHPATRSFQAIRIFINQELQDLEQCLQDSIEILAPNGRLVIISFHSLEDRIVKRFFKKQSRGDDFPADLPVTQAQLNPTLRIIGRAIKADKDELNQNPRARSAMLRIAEKLT